MATATAFGSITIIDVTDIGEFSVYPMSNMPLTTVFEPDTGANGTYKPEWTSTTPLELKPVIYYGGESIAAGSTGLTVSWKKMAGTTEVALTANEVQQADGTLKVTANQFSSSVSMVTYIVTCTYVPFEGETLTAVGQVTFSLVRNSSAVRNVSITGDTLFKYDTENNVLPATITLNAECTNVSIESWQYKHPGDSTWQHTFSGTASTSLTISPTHDCFMHSGTSYDTVSIRVVTHDNQDSSKKYYDTTTIVKLRDGAAGTSSLSMVLSNESQLVPCNSENNPTSPGDLGSTTVQLYVGGKYTADYNSSITVTPNGVTGTWDATSGTYTVTGWASANTSDVASVNFRVNVDGSAVSKSMNLTKIKTGADGVSPTIYSLEVSSLVSNLKKDKTYSPSSITINAYKHEKNTTTPFAGYLEIYVDDQSTSKVHQTMTGGVYTISSVAGLTYTVSNVTYTPTKNLLCKLYNGQGGTLLDTQTIVITNDGLDGEQGETGKDGIPAINVVLGNYSDTIGANAKLKANNAASMDLNIPFTAYCGTQKISCTATAPGRICNNKISYNTSKSTLNASSTADGKIVYTIAAGADLNPTSGTAALTGVLPLSFSIPSQTVTIGGNEYSISASTFTCNYTWTIVQSAANSVVFQLLTPSGYAYQNGAGFLTIEPYLLNGATEVTTGAGATYTWYEYASGSYTQVTPVANEIEIVDSRVLKVYGKHVNGYSSFKCVANYDSVPYTQYTSLIDKTDPLQVYIYSTVGQQIVNHNGVGAMYCTIMRNGEELDPIATTNFTTTDPTVKDAVAETSDKKCYYINGDDHSVKLYEYVTGTKTWRLASTQPAYTTVANYQWSYRGADNEPYSATGLATTGKIVFINADLINNKLNAQVQVTLK